MGNLQRIYIDLAIVGLSLSCSGDPKKDSHDSPSDLPIPVQDTYESISPILANHCVPCHRIEDANGRVRMDAYFAVKRDAGRALLCLRGICPTSGLSRMPPGLARWSDDEKLRLTAYFQNGAPQ